eukprot:scaffold315493_cov32-Tisochrysis_lutea.AAC.2
MERIHDGCGRTWGKVLRSSGTCAPSAHIYSYFGPAHITGHDDSKSTYSGEQSQQFASRPGVGNGVLLEVESAAVIRTWSDGRDWPMHNHATAPVARIGQGAPCSRRAIHSGPLPRGASLPRANCPCPMLPGRSCEYMCTERRMSCRSKASGSSLTPLSFAP